MAQHHDEQHAGNDHAEGIPEGESLKKYKLALTLGYTHIPAAFEEGKEEEAVFVPSVGLDLLYSLNHKWALGLAADLELSDYIVDFRRDDLNREKAFILVLLASYEVLPGLGVLAGGGIELERNKNLMVARTGVEYEYPLGNAWSVGPALFFDFKEDFSTWAFSIAVGKRF